jgi:hypothetical protein
MVDATVISAFATTHGMRVATSGTAALEASPTPPPSRTNRAKEPEEAGAGRSDVCIGLSHRSAVIRRSAARTSSVHTETIAATADAARTAR